MNWWETAPASKPLAERLVRLRELIKPKAPPGEREEKERVKQNLGKLGRLFWRPEDVTQEEYPGYGTKGRYALAPFTSSPVGRMVSPPLGREPINTPAGLAEAAFSLPPAAIATGGASAAIRELRTAIGAGKKVAQEAKPLGKQFLAEEIGAIGKDVGKTPSRVKTAGLPPSPAVAPKVESFADIGTKQGLAERLSTYFKEPLAKYTKQSKAELEQLWAQTLERDREGLIRAVGSGRPTIPEALPKAGVTRAEEQAAAIAKIQSANLPPVPEGYIRLYRGERGINQRPIIPSMNAPISETMKPGRWFTSDIGYASFYGPDLAYVDVPKAVAIEAGAGRAATGANLSMEWAAKAKPVSPSLEDLPKVEPPVSKAGSGGIPPIEPPKPPVTPEESENLIKEFGRRITSKEPELFAEAQRRQISSQKSVRIAAMEELYQKNLDSGMDVEQALFKAAGALKGEYARKPLSLGDIFAPVREQLFAKIDRTITMPIERLATGEALEKLLETGKIANVPGTKGGSQLSRLRAVFKDQPEILKALENPDEFLTKNYPPMGPRPSFLDLPVEGSQQSLGLDIPGSPRGTLNYAPTGKLGLEGGGEQLGLLQPTYEASPFAPSRAKTAMERLLEKQALEAEVVGTKPSPSPGPINIPEQGLWAPEQRPLIPQGPIPESAPLPRVSAAQRELELQALQAELGGNARQVLGPMIQYPEGSVGRQLSALPDSARERLLKVLKRVGIEAVEILNLPRVIRVSYDVSMPLRQGLVLGVRYPIKLGQSIKTMFKMGLTERTAGELERAVWRRPGTGKFILSEGYLAPISQRGKLPIGLQEEARMAQRWMRKIPGVALSERMALVFLNDFRSRVWEDAYETLMRIKAPEEEFKGAAKYINAASGRGELPKVLRGSAPIINQLLFSPRLVASRLQLPTMLFSASPVQRKMAWQGLVSMLTFGAGVLGLATLMGAKVEKDPRSSAAYKLRFGNTTVDIWGGYQQYARFAAQLATSSRKTMKGDIQEITRLSALGRFGQSKAAPLLSIILDLLQKETYVGEKLEATPQFISKYALEQITPFVLQDAYDAMRENGVIGGTALGVLSAFGAGITTIPPEKPKEAFPVRKAKGTSSSTSSAKRTTLTSDEIESLRKASRIP